MRSGALFRPRDASSASTIVVTSISPSQGTALGGTNVTITGSGFTGATSGTIGGAILASFVVVNDTTITARTAPWTPNDGYSVRITGPSGTAIGGSYTYAGVISCTPVKGTADGGTAVTISGYGFTIATAAAVGTLGNVSSFAVVNAHTITGVTHAMNIGLTQVAVGFSTGESHAKANAYTGVGITSISPTTGPSAGGTAVTLTGVGFTGATSASVGGVPLTSFVLVSDTTITGVTGEKAAGSSVVTVAVTVTNGCKPLVNAYTYVAPPLSLKLDASAGDFTFVGGLNVSAWGDESGNGRTMANTSGAQLPVYEGTSGPGGRATVEFKAFTTTEGHTSDYLARDSFAASGNGYTVVMVVASTMTSDAHIFGHESGVVGSNAKGFAVGMHLASGLQRSLVSHFNGSSFSDLGGIVVFTEAFRVISFRCAAGSTPKVRVNNVAVETLGALTYVNPVAGSPMSLFLENGAFSGSLWVSELQYFDGVHSEADVSAIEVALATKWGT